MSCRKTYRIYRLFYFVGQQMFEYRKHSKKGSHLDSDESFAVVFKQFFCIISGIK
jgi:hypothetical protein